MRVFLNLGMNLVREDGSGILAEARKHFPDHGKLVVLHMEGDQLLEAVRSRLPEDTDYVPIRKDGTLSREVLANENDVLICTGGTTSQNHGMQIVGLLQGSLYDLRGGEAVRLAPLMPNNQEIREMLISYAVDSMDWHGDYGSHWALVIKMICESLLRMPLVDLCEELLKRRLK